MSTPIRWSFGPHSFTFGIPGDTMPLVMGILNVTPDSFSDGGNYVEPQAAADRAHAMVAEGADIIDIGGESTRPGAEPVASDEELRRVMPVVEALVASGGLLISIDTSKPDVARHAIAAGARIVNDVTAMQDPAMAEVVAGCDAGVILMHMQGTPETMQIDPSYHNVVADVKDHLRHRLLAAQHAGIDSDRVVLDPGIGFGKTVRHNLLLLRHLDALAELARPVCLGVSRKSFMGKLLNRPADQRLGATLAATVLGYLRGAHVIRTHDVRVTRDALTIARAIEAAE